MAATTPPPSPDSEFVDLTGDGGVLKRVTRAPTSDALGPPPAGDEVKAHYTGTLQDGTQFDSSRDRGSVFKFTIGQGQVIKGWDVGFAAMKVGERAVLRCRADYAYGEDGSPPTIPAGATLDFDVELLGFGPREKDKWEMSDAEKQAAARKYKEKGTELFKAGQYQLAADEYLEGVGFAEPLGAETAADLVVEYNEIFVSLQLNRSQVRARASERARGAARVSSEERNRRPSPTPTCAARAVVAARGRRPVARRSPSRRRVTAPHGDRA